MTLHPTSDLVSVAWINNIPDIPPDCCATTVPDQEKWHKGPDGISQFISTLVIGGSPPMGQAPIAAPVVEVRCWATKLTSNKPPWNTAAQLAEIIRYAAYDRAIGQFGQPLHIAPGGKQYATATVTGVAIHLEPRRIYSDARNYAVYQFDMTMMWREVGVLIA